MAAYGDSRAFWDIKVTKAENFRQNIRAPDDLVCWTRMQSEAGEGLTEIVARKEAERKAGKGVFFWGVGNPPAVATQNFARLKAPVQAIFSIMKSRPKVADTAPRSLLVWRRYFDLNGVERDLPSHVLITSRGDANGVQKTRHYALMCYSRKSLELQHGTPFDPTAYRNTGANGGPVGASQVTALVRRVKEPSDGTYEANLKARLTGSYWVKLSDPITLIGNTVGLLRKSDSNNIPDEWIAKVSSLRERITNGNIGAEQPNLF